MRRFLVVLVALAACTTPAPPTEPAAPSTAEVVEPAPTQLPAMEPQQPTLAEFRREAARACATANAAIAGAPLRGDPFREGARGRDRRAAVDYYRTAAAAWTAAAGELFDYGLPEEKVGERFITSLDTVAQYSHQTADLIEERDDATAQLGVGAVDTAMVDTNRIAERLGIGRVEECGRRRPQLRDPTRVPVDAVDFSFSVTTPASGATRFVLRNRGTEPHSLFVVPLREPGTLDDAIRADRDAQRPGAFLREDGAASAVASPGSKTSVDVRLRRGAYGLICFVASEDGTPHAYKGMATEVDVS